MYAFSKLLDIEPGRKHSLVNGLDDIALTLEKMPLIKEYENRRRVEAPWLFAESR